MYIAVFIIGLLAANLVVLLFGIFFMKRELQRQFVRDEEWRTSFYKSFYSLDSSVDMAKWLVSRLIKQQEMDRKMFLDETEKTGVALRNMCGRLDSISNLKNSVDALEKRLKENIQTLPDGKKLEHISAVLQRMEANMDILRECTSRMAGSMQDMTHILAALQEVEADFDERLEKLMRETPEALPGDDEAKHSRAIEEGISNLLQYQGGKGREQL